MTNLKTELCLTTADEVNNSISVKKTSINHQRAVDSLRNFVKTINNKDPKHIADLLTARCLNIERNVSLYMELNEEDLFETTIEEIDLILTLIE